MHNVNNKAKPIPRNRAKSSFNISHKNIRGLRSNFHHIESYLNKKNGPDMFCLCETNLYPPIPDIEFNISGYTSL